MIFWYETDSGKIRQASQGVITPMHHDIFPEGGGVAVIELDADASVIDTHYISNGVLIEKPPRPSGWHSFDYATKQWVDPRTEQTQWPVVRSQRDALLSASDWTQLPDVPLATKETWAIYRQALRDITEQTDPFNINWPVQPDRKS